jgi:hypothetical protein
MDLDDPRWTGLHGGYRIPYDPRGALRALAEGKDVAVAWQELWGELHHQGDVGEASYAAVPQLVRIHAARGVADWNTYGLVAIIEEARQSGRNPELPANLRHPYEAAWRELMEIGLTELKVADDTTLVCSIISVLAIGKGQLNLGRFAIFFPENERQEILAKAGAV